MVLPLSSTAITEKNLLATDSIWYIALEITIPGVGTPVRVVANNENITWDGETWIAFPFEIEEIGEESKGEVPEVNLRVSNVSRTMETYLQDFDAYTKTNGYTPITVAIYCLNSKNLASATPESVHYFELIQPKTDPLWATFRLGAANPFNKRFPRHRLLKNHCRFIFKGALCGYSGSGTTCDKTLTTCRTFTDSAYHDPPDSLGNAKRYGGTPGVGSGGIRLVK